LELGHLDSVIWLLLLVIAKEEVAMQCPKCQATNPILATFCRQCGEPLLPSLILAVLRSRLIAGVALAGLVLGMLLGAAPPVVNAVQVNFFPTPTPTATPTRTPTPTVTPSLTPTPMPPTDTPTITPTKPTLPPPSDTSTRTPTPTPTKTRTPSPTPPCGHDPQFRADQTLVPPSGCTVLRWDVEGIREVYLNGNGVVGHSYQHVCPSGTTTYRLTVIERDGRRCDWPLTIQVGSTRTGPTPTYTRVPTVRSFRVEYKSCIGGTSAGIGVVKGQVLDRQGHPLMNAKVGINLFDAWWQNPANPAPVNADGWYEFYLSPKQKVTFVRLWTPDGRDASLDPRNYSVESVGGCYQNVNFIEK
jgi:hypothetical protein